MKCVPGLPMTSFRMRAVGLCGCTVLLGMLVGCASPGQPRPPSLHLPERVGNLTAAREGGGVKLRFTAPLKTTEGELLAAPGRASVCRALADGPCLPAQSLPVKTPVSGAVEWVDVLPPELTAGAARRIAYRVEVFNAAGRSAGPSDPAFAVAGEAPRNIGGFQVEGSHSGVVLRWTPDVSGGGEVLVERESLSPVEKDKPAKKSVAVPKGVGGRKARHASPAAASVAAATDESEVWLHATSAGDNGGMVDATAHPDEAYRYRAVRSRFVTVDGLKLEARSEASAAVTFTLKDVFPPAVPQGLTVAGFPVEGKEGLSVDLVWQPDADRDLAGYNVYRQALTADGSAGPTVKLNVKLVALPGFRDEPAGRGVGYRYTVTAVDAKGNESAASVAAELAAVP